MSQTCPNTGHGTHPELEVTVAPMLRERGDNPSK
jgi:hypothetical protein